jgi:hypothetical protein
MVDYDASHVSRLLPSRACHQTRSERKWLFRVPCPDFIIGSRHHHFITTAHHDGELDCIRKNMNLSMNYCAGYGCLVFGEMRTKHGSQLLEVVSSAQVNAWTNMFGGHHLSELPRKSSIYLSSSINSTP